jgi:hypothetical protein
MRRVMPKFFLALALAIASAAPLHAQYFFQLDPSDPATYRHWTEKNYQYAVKLTAPTFAGQVVSHTVNKASEVPTPQVDPARSNGPGSFWGIRVPEWVKAQVKNPFSGVGVTGQDETLSKMFQGLSMYQRARATLKTAGLVRASLRGLRFEMDAWRMLADIMAFDNTDQNGGGNKIGTVTFSLVPKGKGTLDELDKLLDDPLYHDPYWSQKIKVIGPTSLGDLFPIVDSIDDTGVQQWTGETGDSTVYRWLEAVDRGARVAGEEIAAVKAYAGMKKAQAMRDAMSPRRLAQQMEDSINQTRDKYRAIEALRGMLEGRGRAEVAMEYDRLADAQRQEARAAAAQAEVQAAFYSNMQNQADNIVSTLNNQERLKDIDAIEKLLKKFLDDNRNDEIGHMMLDFIKSACPNLISFVPPTPPKVPGSADTAMTVPYAGLVTQAVDYLLVTRGVDPDSSAKDGVSPVTGMLKEYQIKALSVRMGYHLWEELRAIRQLMMLKEQRDMALRGISDSQSVESSYQRAQGLAKERELGLAKLRFLNDKVNAWLKVD